MQMKCMVIPDQSVDRLGCVDLWEAPVKAANGPSKLSNAFDVKHAQVIFETSSGFMWRVR